MWGLQKACSMGPVCARDSAVVFQTCHPQICGGGASRPMLEYQLKAFINRCKRLGLGGGEPLVRAADASIGSWIEAVQCSQSLWLTLRWDVPQSQLPGQQAARCSSGSAPCHAPDNRRRPRAAARGAAAPPRHLWPPHGQPTPGPGAGQPARQRSCWQQCLQHEGKLWHQAMQGGLASEQGGQLGREAADSRAYSTVASMTMAWVMPGCRWRLGEQAVNKAEN